MDLKPRTSDGQLAAGSLDVGAKPRSELEARSAHGVAAFDNRDRVNESEVAGVANVSPSRVPEHGSAFRAVRLLMSIERVHRHDATPSYEDARAVSAMTLVSTIADPTAWRLTFLDTVLAATPDAP